VERTRFEERLRVAIDVPSDLCALRVPALLLQPLVENAVKHGIAPARGGGEVTIDARLEPDAGETGDGVVLTVRVQNTGKPLAATLDRRREGVGLRNLEQRLKRHYGPAASLRIENCAGATRAEVRVPVAPGALERQPVPMGVQSA
jgi:LytS/YehU family sensor histidine kinase